MYSGLIRTLRDGDNCNILDCVDDAANVIEALVAENEKLREENRWIPVGERPPDESGYYFVAGDDFYHGMNISYYLHKAQNWKAAYNQGITHWRPFPEPPKGESNGH